MIAPLIEFYTEYTKFFYVLYEYLKRFPLVLNFWTVWNIFKSSYYGKVNVVPYSLKPIVFWHWVWIHSSHWIASTNCPNGLLDLTTSNDLSFLHISEVNFHKILAYIPAWKCCNFIKYVLLELYMVAGMTAYMYIISEPGMCHFDTRIGIGIENILQANVGKP